MRTWAPDEGHPTFPQMRSLITMARSINLTLGRGWSNYQSMTHEPFARRRKTLAGALAAAAVLLAPVVALALKQKASFETRIHGHEFSEVSLTNSGDCLLSVRILFTAPDAGYTNESPPRNVYRFHVRTKLAGDRATVTRVFNNKVAGARAYSYVQDTSAEGCWAKEELKIQGIDVEGCRGAGCTPDPFQ